VWPIVAVAVVVVSVAGTTALYGARRTIAREAVAGWLASHGVEGEIQVRAFELDGFTGSLRIGPASAPDLSVETIEAHYGLQGFWTGDPLGVRIISIRLQRPVLKGSFHKGVLHLGALDPILAEFRRQPPQPNAAKPKILVDDARLQLDSDYGLVRARASARIDDGKLMALTARFEPMALHGPGLTAVITSGDLKLTTRVDRVEIALAAPVSVLRAPDLAVQDAMLRLSAQAPYPDLERRRGDGKLSLRMTATAAKLGLGPADLGAVSQTFSFDGATTGWIDSLVVTGAGAMTVQAARVAASGATAERLSLAGDFTDLQWTRAAGDSVRAGLSLNLAIDRLAQADLHFTGLKGAFSGTGRFGREGAGLSLRGGISSRGGWTSLGAVVASDPPETAALKRALASFTLVAPDLAIEASGQGLSLGLSSPVRLRTAGGGQASLQALGNAPLFRDGKGAFRLIAGGGGLPSLDLTADRFTTGPETVAAHGRLEAQGAFGPVQGASLDAVGTLTLARGVTSFAADGCIPIRADRMEMGANDITKLGGELCPVKPPLFTLADGRWRLRGRAAGVEAQVLEIALSQAAGPLDFSGKGEALSGTLDLKAAQVGDLAPQTRFRPLRASGRARLAGGVWRADLALADPAGRPIGQAQVRHDQASGVGGATFDTGLLAFADGGLQPAALSPLAAAIGSPATGQVRFTGKADWTSRTLASSGLLDVVRLDFRSPAGAVTGLSGQVALSGLAPPTAAPGQVLAAETVDLGVAKLIAPRIEFSLDPNSLQVAGAQLGLGGGQVTLEPLSIPLAPGKPWEGTVVFKDVQLSDIVEASPFGDRMDLTAKVTGRAPFVVSDAGVKVVKGELHAVEPGRLSILREALTNVAADGAAVSTDAPVPAAAAAQTPDTMTDFAYQAMENLAFETLDAQVNSLPEGRLGVLFHIKGEHSPPKAQQLTLTLKDLITRDFLKRSLPLPSGTKVDLTLDTSLNLDKLLADVAEYQRLRGSHDVQPPTPKVTP
jgi:hypothetical protein